MCVYGKDNPLWFRQAVDSLLGQTVFPPEIVLVVDGPVPPELNAEIIRCEQLSLFKVIRLSENVGHGNARRISLEHCSHELVALMDADDICVPDRFEKQLAAFEEDPMLSIVGGNIAEFIDNTQNVVGYRVVETQHENIAADMKKRCPLNQVTVMFRKTDVEEVGGYIDWYCEEDYYLWLRLLLGGKRFSNIKDNLVYVRVGKEMYQRRGGWKYFESEAKLQLFMRQERVIGWGTCLINIAKRLVVQVLLPNKVRSWVFQKFARTQKIK